MDAEVRAADERVERAKHSLGEHVDELGRRLSSVKDREHIEKWIAAHPWRAVGIAFSLGGIAALAAGSSRGHAKVQRSVGGVVAAALGAVTIRMLKGAAADRIASALHDWLDSRAESSDSAVSRVSAIESFFEH